MPRGAQVLAVPLRDSLRYAVVSSVLVPSRDSGRLRRRDPVGSAREGFGVWLRCGIRVWPVGFARLRLGRRRARSEIRGEGLVRSARDSPARVAAVVGATGEGLAGGIGTCLAGELCGGFAPWCWCSPLVS